jgi:transposase
VTQGGPYYPLNLHSSGGTSHLGPISKRGDRYLRMLLTHGTRSVLRAASVAVRAGKTVDGLRQWSRYG